MTPDRDPTRTAPPDAPRTGEADSPTVTKDPAAALRDLLDAGATVAPNPGTSSAIDPPPGFAIERELGIGGMGVVYLARQVGLNRLVALKLVRDSPQVNEKALIRFLAEAEAVAAVRHPNVVEVYSYGVATYGTHRGRPYLALEYCPGGDLTTLSRANHVRDAGWFRRVAELLGRIAGGVDAAHVRGIVHRDLKPGNVLLTDDGTPKVADFGLAKRGVGSDLTNSQAVLGTPAYMAPEQAGGGTKFVGPEADVWALGVMLFELCCGQRPIDTSGPMLDVLARVVRAEVPPLWEKCPTVPRDLALIVHKCLSADPRDRYPTAGGLATDLRNWLDGKPISARPAGTFEQAVKWARRNKRLAGMGLAAFLTMATATGVSLGFGLETEKQAGIARKKQKDAEDATERADRETERAQRTLAKALLGPIATTENYGLSSFEQDALWELTALRGGPVGLMVVEEATRTPPAVARFRHRGAYLSHTTFGLDSRKWREVDVLLGTRVGDASLLAEWKGDVVSAAERPANAESVADAVTALEKGQGGSGIGLPNRLVEVVERLPADQAASVCGKAADRLAEALGKAMDAFGREALALGLAAVAQRLSAVQASAVCGRAADTLAEALGKATDGSERRALANGLAAVAERLPAGPAAYRLAEALGKATDGSEREVLANGLAAVAERLPAEKGVEVLTAALVNATAADEWRALAEGLAAVTSGLSKSRRIQLSHASGFATLIGSVTRHPAVLPRPRPLPPQQLVELLKHPFVVKEARRAVLDALEFTYDRWFADLWEFVAFAEKEHPELDLLTPPKRPERK